VSVWGDALLVAQLFASDPAAFGGVVVRAGAGPVRDAWLVALKGFIRSPATAGAQPQIEVRGEASKIGPVWAPAFAGELPFRKMPIGISDERLLGGLDLTATLAGGGPVARKGLLAEADGGVLIIPMAERLAEATGHLCAALDTGEVITERDGMALRSPARIGLVLLDEGVGDEQPPTALVERCAFLIDLSGVGFSEIPHAESSSVPPEPFDFAQDKLRPKGRSRGTSSSEAENPFAQSQPTSTSLGIVSRLRSGGTVAPISDTQITTLCATAAAFGIQSIRAPLHALNAAKALAALAGRADVDEEDVIIAARLTLAPRALTLPPFPEDQQAEPPPPPSDNPEGEGDNEQKEIGELADVVLEAVRAALPEALLAQLEAGQAKSSAARGSGSGALRKSLKRGRPAGVRRGDPGGQARLHLVETLRAAAPWQKLRQGQTPREGIIVRRDDFRIRRFAERAESTMIFAVDASGSAALERLAETKGAVELLLAEAYIRRTQVALVAFRGAQAELLLPPTRSLARAKKCLAGLAGGGGTPLASGVEATQLVAEAAKSKGRTPFVIMMTDGRANIARDGTPGRPQANEDAIAAAKRFRSTGVAAAVIDISARPREYAVRFAAAMGARYAALPRVEAGAMRDLARSLDPTIT
jgi:magnesium chelatase subunit D